MDNLIKAVVSTLTDDAKLTAAGRLGSFLNKATTAPFGITSENPPIDFTGLWITYNVSSLADDQSQPGVQGGIIWTFTVHNCQKINDAYPVLARIHALLQHTAFNTATSSGQQVYYNGPQLKIFDEDKNAYSVSGDFNMANVKLYILGV